MSIHTRKRACGFTLIEILLALMIFGLVVMAVFASWRLIMRGTRVGLDAAAAAQRSRVAIRAIENSLTSARAFAADMEYYGFVAENGSQATLSFVAKLPPAFPRGGKFGGFDVRRVTFSLEPGPSYGHNELVLRQNPILMDMDEDERTHPVVLARNVKAFEMEFWDRNSRDWLEDWTETNQLPNMVKITLEFTGSGPQSRVQETITRIVALPATTVPQQWQTPGRAGPQQPGRIGNQPGRNPIRR